MRRFPKLEIEKRCLIERRFREAARQSYFERLKNDPEAKARILEEGRSTADEAGKEV